MRRQQEMIAEFHAKHRFPVGVNPGDNPQTDMVRVHLIAEELAELALAIANKNQVGVADALADLAYVVLGAAVTYNIPLEEVFQEVHRSNMTKAVRGDEDTRLRSKGAGYTPPDIAGVLEAARRAQLVNEMGDPH